MSKRFLRSMAQPYDQDQTGISLWSLDDIEEKQRQQAMSMEVDQPEGNAPRAIGPEDAYFAGLEDSDVRYLALGQPLDVLLTRPADGRGYASGREPRLVSSVL